MPEQKTINYELLYKMIECVKREVAMRYKVYPGRVKAGKMTQQEAETEQKLMYQVQLTLQKIYNGQAPETVQKALFDTDIYKPKKQASPYDGY